MQPTHLIFRKASLGLVFSLCSLALVALPISNVLAHEGEDHTHGPATTHASTGADGWKTAQASLKGIEAAAAAKQHEPIHNEQEKLAAALKSISSEGAADKARFEGAIKNAIAASEKVHTAADGKDFAKVESSLKTLKATMALVEKQLPAAK